MKDSESRRHHHSQHRPGIFWPLLLIAGGVIFLLGNFQLIPTSGWDLLWRLWPLILIAGGLDGLLRREGFVGSIVVIGLGTIFLLANLDLVTVSPWSLIVRFWPVFIIAWGLDLIIGRRSVLSALVGVIVGIALIAGIFWMAGIGPMLSQSSEVIPLSQNLDDLKDARVVINATGGSLDLSGGAEPNKLLNGKIAQLNPDSFENKIYTANGKAEISLRNQAPAVFYPFSGGIQQPVWQIKLNDSLPMDVDTHLVLGTAQIDLTGTKIRYLESQVVMGESRIVLPATGKMDGKIKGVMGSTVILVPRGKMYRFNVDPSLASVSYPPEFQRNGAIVALQNPPAPDPTFEINLTIEQVIGSIQIKYLP